MNDQSAARMILDGIEHPLTAQQQAELDAYLDASPQTQQFADWVKRIELVAEDSRALETSGEIGPGLSELSRFRLQRQLQTALAAKSGMQGYPASNQGGERQAGGNCDIPPADRLVAEPDDEYRAGPPEDGHPLS